MVTRHLAGVAGLGVIAGVSAREFAWRPRRAKRVATSLPVTIGELATTLDIHRSTATRLCNRLERKGLVRRRMALSEDRRETPVVVAATGRRLVNRVTEQGRRDVHRIAAWMSPADRQHAIVGLTAFAVASGELPGVDRFGWADYTGNDVPTTR